MDLFGMGGAEIILVLVIALVVLGPKRVVEFAGTLGKMVLNLKKMTSDLTTTVTKEINMEEERGHQPPEININSKTGNLPGSDQGKPDGDEPPPPED